MKRVWFKKEMKQAILDGKKVSTTRDHPLGLGKVLAVSGSRFKAEPFAVLEILSSIRARVGDVIHVNYQEEGFSSTCEMMDYLEKNKLLQKSGPVWFHRFKIVEKLKEVS